MKNHPVFKSATENIVKKIDLENIIMKNYPVSKSAFENIIKNNEIDPRMLKITKIIARGAFGCIYQGIYNNKKVAVKVFRMDGETCSESMESFVQEVYLSKDHDHPNIIKFIGLMKNMSQVKFMVKESKDFDPAQACCVVTELISRGTLYEYLKKHNLKKLPIRTVIQLALGIAEGLSYLHAKKIMHRDVKTHNMLIDKNGRVKIIDFELAGVEDVSELRAYIGTLGYKAPEVHVGDLYDHKCDVYSFGICLWEIYCCSHPYDMEAIYDTIKENPVLYKGMRPQIPSSCPSTLADLMKQCWDANPKKRPEMSSVVRTLMEFEESTSYRCGKGARCFSC